MKEKWNLELSEYIKQGEPTQVEKTKNCIIMLFNQIAKLNL